MLSGHCLYRYPEARLPFLQWGVYISQVFEKMKKGVDAIRKRHLESFKVLGDLTRYKVVELIDKDVSST